MNAVAEIGKAGRIVVPKQLRDALHLVAGARRSIRLDGSAILIEPEVRPHGLQLRDGMVVCDAGTLSRLEDRDWLQESRDRRVRDLQSGAPAP